MIISPSRIFAGAVFLFIFVMVTHAYAYRPLTTDDADVVGKGKVQLEASWDHSWVSGLSIQEIFLLVPAVGPTEWLETGVELPLGLSKTQSQDWQGGIGDLRPYMKFRLVKEKGARPGIAVKTFFKFATGDSGKSLGTGYNETGLFAIVSKTLGRFRLNAMLGGNFIVNDRENANDTVIYGVSLDYRIATIHKGPIYILTEFFGNTNADPSIPSDPHNWFVGFSYEFSPSISLDGGIGIGLSDAAPDIKTTLGMVFGF